MEYLPKEEVDMHQVRGALEEKIDDIVDKRTTFDACGDGMALKALKSKLGRATKSLSDIGVYNSVLGVASTATNSPNQDFLDSVIEFINDETIYEDGQEGDADGIEEAGISLDTFPQAPTNTSPSQEYVLLTDV